MDGLTPDNRHKLLIAAIAAFALASAAGVALFATWIATGDSGWAIASVAHVLVLAGFAIVWSRVGRLSEVRENLRRSELLYAALFETVQEGVFLTDAAFDVEFVNDRVLEMTGYRREDVVGRSITMFIDPEDRAFIAARLQARAAGKRESYELRVPRRGGGHILAQISATPRVAADGTFRGTLVTVVDVTRSVDAERQIALKSAEQHAIATVAQTALEDDGLDRLFEVAARATTEALGLDLCNIYQMTQDRDRMEIRARVGWPADVPARQSISARAYSLSAHALQQDDPLIVDDLRGDDRFDSVEDLLERGIRSSMVAVIRLNGGVFGVIGCHSLRPGRFSRGEATFVQAIAYLLATAISRHADAEALRNERARLQGILDTTVDAIVTLDSAGRIDQLNAAAETMFGCAAADVRREDIRALVPACDEAFLSALAADVADHHADASGLRRDGGAFPVEMAAGIVKLGDERLTILTIRDVSLRRAAEDQLRQAQKMEAVGQLTGGIAHDFNNLLTVIVGNSELLTEALAGKPDLHELAEHALQAAEKGAGLTRRLLAFSRRQTLQPTRIDLQETIGAMIEMLRRTLGGQIEIDFAAEPDLWATVVDRTQLETTILNLALNARDAMPRGGRLNITARNAVVSDRGPAAPGEIAPGEYVEISVADTGAGMPSDVAARVFEPFFTTKDVGKGTGLGLSMVYGFVKQSGGHVTIDSEPDAGTTVTVYMPRAGEPARPASSPSPSGQTQAGNGETILVAEDDPSIRRQVVDSLTALGYRVIHVPDGPSALALIESGERIDLLFTDLTMPGGLSGAFLARRAAVLRPSLPVLFTSGYPPAEVTDAGDDIQNVPLLMKPYRKGDMARMVREALDRRVPEPEPETVEA